MVGFLFLVLGFAVGSFLNVVILRMGSEETIGGRSHCRNCDTQIRWYDNIPILSFFWLRGRCRMCHQAISWQYPAVEVFTGIFFWLIGSSFFDPADRTSWLESLWLLGVVSLFVIIAVYDILKMEILVALLWTALLWTLLYYGLSFEWSESLWWGREVQALVGALVVGGFFLTLVLVSDETWMGWGDVWLGAIAGLMVGLPAVLFMVTLSFGIGAVVGVTALLLGNKTMKSQLPFAPFLALGTLLTLLLPHIIPQYTWAFLLSV